MRSPEVVVASRCGSCHVAHYVEAGQCRDCHRGDPAASRKELAHARLLTGGASSFTLRGGDTVREGERLVEGAACRRCHTIGGVGNRLATVLDVVVWKREQAELAASIRAPVTNMPDFGFDPRQADAVIAYLLSRRSLAPVDESYRVRFAVSGIADANDVFGSKCGECHRALTAGGPIGKGAQGPNLSGLFTSRYPANAPGAEAWSPQTLERWLKNPRALRPVTTMPPVSLSDGELRRVIEQLTRPSS